MPTFYSLRLAGRASEQGIRPGLEYMTAVVAELLVCPASDARVARTVASIRSQWTAYIPNPVLARLGFKTRLSAEEIDEIADHITAFSMGGIRAVRSR